jgi:hypothetical protein
MQAETASLPQSSASDGLPFSEKQVSQHCGYEEPDGTAETETLELPIAETETLALLYGIALEETGLADEAGAVQ